MLLLSSDDLPVQSDLPPTQFWWVPGEREQFDEMKFDAMKFDALYLFELF